MRVVFSHCPADKFEGDDGCAGCPALPGTEHCEAVFVEAAIAEIFGPDGRVHYRRPPDDPMIEDARNTPGYSVRFVSSNPNRRAPKMDEDVALQIAPAEAAIRERAVDGRITGTTSYVQRKLQCGYNRAASILDVLVERGVISEPDREGARHILKS